MEQSMQDIKVWMDQVRLKMNDSKTEFHKEKYKKKIKKTRKKNIYLAGPSQLGKCITSSISVNNEIVERATSTKYLGAYLDS